MLVQNFETFWAYYHQSGGHLFDQECRRAADLFLSVLDELTEKDPGIKETFYLELRGAAAEHLEKLQSWAKSSEPFPFPSGAFSRFALFIYLWEVKEYLVEKLGFVRTLPMSLTSEEIEHSRHVVRWKGHLPYAALTGDPNKLLREASDTQTIVVVGDIRRSQDLMTYSVDPQDFSQRMVEFITVTRHLIDKYGGLFDKFTGDGFVAYFNEAVCLTAGVDFVEAFLSFIYEELDFSRDHFAEWSTCLRKLPEEDIGLAIGGDRGKIEFNDLDHHLVAVGEPLVWAARMEAVAKANEVIVNNLLYGTLAEHVGFEFERRQGTTKTGEAFLGRVLLFNDSCAFQPTLVADHPALAAGASAGSREPASVPPDEPTATVSAQPNGVRAA